MTDEKRMVSDLWTRVAEGRHSATLGLVIGEPPESASLRLVRVSCDVPPSTLGPLLDARRKVENVLGGAPPLFDQARQIVFAGLRRRLLGDDVSEDGADGTIVEAFNRLARQEGLRSAILFDAIDAADDATLDALRQIVRRVGWLELPLILSFRSANPSGKAAALLDVVRSVEGPSAVFEAPPADRAPIPRDASAEPARPGRSREAAPPKLSSDVLRVLRAGALIGTGFEAELVAALLRVEPLDVIEALQRAADAGVAIDDRGEGRFHLSESLVDDLRGSLLPSLARAWHRRLASLLSSEEKQHTNAVEAPLNSIKMDEDGPPDAPSGAGAPWPYSELFGRSQEPPAPPAAAKDTPAPSAEPPAAPPPSAPPTEAPRAPAPSPIARSPEVATSPASSEPSAPEATSAPNERWPAAPADPRAASASPAERSDPSNASRTTDNSSDALGGADDDEPAPETPPLGSWINPFSVNPELSRPKPAPAKARAPEPRARQDEVRAASHLTAAGEIEGAAERYAAAVRRAADAGAYSQALMHGKRALDLLTQLPVSPKRRRLRASVLTELGRLQWLAAGPNLPFTLAGALEALEAARALLNDSDPLDQRAEVAALIAGVCYDMGDMRSLERALEELTTSSRAFLDAGDAVSAARLLNDQAAVYVRMGDPVRATHLLGESRKVFESMGSNDPIAVVELAETDHLFARIPLHVAARPGREQDALSMGLDHAIAAERTYKKIGAKRELGRVWETMGRLELAKGRLERAEGRLASALELQRSIGDVLGLARTTATLSEVLAAGGRPREALSLLGNSIALNLEKGSPLGLAFNRRVLEALGKQSPSVVASRGLWEQVVARLERGEAALGRMKLPGEID